jgi:uncharacterized protein
LPPLDAAELIAGELSVARAQVAAVLALAGDGATVPFIARYRKEATGGLDEVQIGKVIERGEYLADLQARKETVLASIEAQGALTDELKARIAACQEKTALEDLYLPWKPKRKTRATAAREKGLQPLAEKILAQEARAGQSREALVAPFIVGEVADAQAAFAGARDIVAEIVAETASVRAALRDLALQTGKLTARVVKGKDEEGAKFRDYFELEQLAREIPSHRMLAIRRGEKEGFLRVALVVDERACVDVARRLVVTRSPAFLDEELTLAIEDACARLLAPAIEVDVRLHLKEAADREAIRVFSENLRSLLLAAPLGEKRVLALDPGLRTGCKVAIVNAQGGLVAHDVIFLAQSEARAAQGAVTVEALCKQHEIEAIAVGNGTGGRETETFLRKLAAEGRLGGAQIVVVSEAGASVYSASEIAREELPDEDVTVRGAVSIGRRLQDPLAELVKIDPKSIGVGQYQHDVNQPTLGKALDSVVEGCVSGVGVDVNTASVKLLSYVAGVGETLAKNIVAHRAANGRFRKRADLRKVARLGPKAFEQAAGFLRVRGGDLPLDDSAVHPESYDLVEKMARDLGVEVSGLVGKKDLVAKIDPRAYVDGTRGEPTLRDILDELSRPGRDPRAKFDPIQFRADVTSFEHLAEGMLLEGVVTNVTAFGAFVDVGVHQDGLVHISELSHQFVRDPAAVVKVGDRVKVKVIKIDAQRRRIGLSVKQASERPAAPPPRPPTGNRPPPQNQPPKKSAPPQQRPPSGPFNGIRIKQR